MVPVREVVSLAQLNAMIERWDTEDERRRIGTRPRPVGEYCTVETAAAAAVAGRTAMMHALELVIYDGQLEVARHERLIAKGKARLDLDHYLEALVREPGAFPGATAPEQARSAGKVHDAWWEEAKAAHGGRYGTRALIEVLLMGRHVAHEHLVAGRGGPGARWRASPPPWPPASTSVCAAAPNACPRRSLCPRPTPGATASRWLRHARARSAS
jgi:hypothetical protein